MLIEELELSGIHIISANTDGIICLFDKSKEKLYYEICNKWEKVVGNEDLGKLEYNEYSMLVQTSVNDYMAVYKSSGNVKYKGDFEIERELHKNPSMKIVSIAISEYFLKGIPVGDTIRKHTNIYDFCLRLKTDRRYIPEYHYWDDGIKIKRLTKTTRYYVSNSGGTLYKRYNKEIETTDKVNELTSVNLGYNVEIFNKYVEKNMNDYNINYMFYITECKKIIDPIENIQLEIF